MKVKKAIFPIAGFGTRFLPATKVMPKEMLTLVNKPIIQYVVEEAKRAGIEEFLFVTTRGKGIIEDHFDISFELEQSLLSRNKTANLAAVKSSTLPNGAAYFIRQQNALGLGHAIYAARKFINNEPFAVILPDEIFLEEEGKSSLKNMLNLFEEKQGNAVVMATTKVPKEKVSAYGIFDVINEEGNVLEARTIIEKPKIEAAPSTYANIGRYILPPEILNILATSKPTIDNEIQLTDAIAKLLPQKQLFAYLFNGRRHDCGNPLGLFEAWVDSMLVHQDFKEKAKEILFKYNK